MGKKCSTRNTGGKRHPTVDRRGAPPQERFEEAEIEQLAINRVEVTRQLVLAAWADLIEGQIRKAKNGGYQQFKLLVDLCGLDNQDESEIERRRREQLCDVLLEGLTLSPRTGQSQQAPGLQRSGPESY